MLQRKRKPAEKQVRQKQAAPAPVFLENEKKANRYTARCMAVLAAIVAAMWLMNQLDLFVVPDGIMTVAAVGGVVLFLLPSLLCRVVREDLPQLKLYIMICCILGITLLSAALPKHAILAWAVPIALSCHYYSRPYTRWTLAACVVCMAASLLVGVYWGEWDSNLLGAMEWQSDGRVIDGNTLRRVTLYYILPRSMILVGVASVCATLSDRTHHLLEQQEKEAKEKQQIASELAIATHIQASMLPCIFPAFPEREEFEVYATMNPAKEVGGDFYDFFMVDDTHLAVVMADVSGKGVPAALFMVIGKTLIKDHTQPGTDLGQVFTQVNELLCASNSEGLFITAFEGVLDLQTGEFRFVNAGHEKPFLCPKGGSFRPQPVQPGLVLAAMEGMAYQAGCLTLSPGDRLFLYTDGVTEAINAQGRFYGIDRLQMALDRCLDKTPYEVLPAVKADIDAFCQGAAQFDDITMLCLSFLQKRKRDGAED